MATKQVINFQVFMVAKKRQWEKKEHCEALNFSYLLEVIAIMFVC